jgi:ABC-type uncharacterized transport system auxiliary subunit
LKYNGPSISVFPNPLAAVFTLGLVVILTGCALWSREMITYHSFDYPSPVKEAQPPIPGTLMVYRFLPAASVDIDSLVVSQSKGTEKTAPLHRWEDNPADMITELVLRDLDNSGLFERTVDQLSSARYRYALEGIIRNLQGTITNGKGKALIAIEATLIDFEARAGLEKNLLKKIYKIEIPSQDATPDSIIKALNLAVKELSERLRNDIRGVLEPKEPEPQKKIPHKAPPSKRLQKKTAMIEPPASCT